MRGAQWLAYLSGDTEVNSALFSTFVCILKEATSRQRFALPRFELIHTSQDELAHGGRKSREKCIEGLELESSVFLSFPWCIHWSAYVVPRNQTVGKLQAANNYQKQHEHIYQLRPLRRGL